MESQFEITKMKSVKLGRLLVFIELACLTVDLRARDLLTLSGNVLYCGDERNYYDVNPLTEKSSKILALM